ncbi:MAG: efflux RND transporter periplasmic adaptor subunit [Hyphomicrobiales bacterium]
MKKWLIAILGLLLVGGAGAYVRQSGLDVVALTGFRPTEKSAAKSADKDKPSQGKAQGGGNRGPLPVEIAQATSARLSDDIGAIGTLLAEETVEIAPETSGRLAAVLFKDGDRVTAGQPLFRLDTDLAEADLTEAKARLSLAEANYKRSQTLRKSGNVAQSVYDAAVTEMEVARAVVDSAQVRLDKLTIVAPFSGLAGFRTVSAGAYVTAGTALVQIDKIDLLKVKFSVPELEQSRIRLGQAIDVTADALPGKHFTATITAIDPSVDVNGRALQVRADLDNADLMLRPGLLVRVTVKGAARDAVLVPETAIVQRGDNAFVFIAKDAKAEEAQVRVGKRVAGAIEIVEGVSPGAEVVVAGNARLSNGAAIEVVKPTAAE